MPLSPLPRTSLSRGCYDALLDAIVSGALAPGAPIRDKQLAAEMGVSRVPVREALKRLEDEGLVETVPNLVTRVAPVRADRAAQAFPVIAALQSLAARLGVPALSAADDRRLIALDQRRAAALDRGDVIAAIELDDAFHGVLLDASGNDELKRALARLMPQIRRLDVLHFTKLSERDSSADHAEIIAACERRDAAAAASLVEENFLRLGAQMASILEAEDAEGLQDA
jgi:DNA-binding GntR family transcriptional regulator